MKLYHLFLLALSVAFSLAGRSTNSKAQPSTAVSATSSDSIVEDVDDSHCVCNGPGCQCCADMKYNKVKQTFCIRGEFIQTTLGAQIDFKHNGQSRWKHNFKAESLKFCPTDMLPSPMDYLRFCMGLYHVNLDTKKKVAQLCFYGEFKVIIPIFSVDFHCLQYKNKRISVIHDIPFKKAGVFHLNLKGLDSEISFHGVTLIKGIYKATVDQITAGLSTKQTNWEKAVYLSETCWEMTPMSHIVEGAKEIAPLLAGAGQWLVTEAMDSLKGIAEEMAHDMEGMNKAQKTMYISKRVALFLPNAVMKGKETIHNLTPFVAGVLKFGAKKLSRAYDELRVMIGKKLKEWNYQAGAIMDKLKVQIDAGTLYGGEVVKGLADSIATSYKNLGSNLKNIVNRIATLKDELDIPYYLDSVFQVASPIITGVADAVKKFGSDVASGVKAAGAAIKKSFNTAVGKVEEGYAKTKGWFKSKFSRDRR